MSAPLEFGCLGNVHLVDGSGAPVDTVLAQPKRLALFAYLLLSDPAAGQSRDALMALFWPESPEDRAQTSLRQALRYLRRELGSEVIVSRGRSWVGVDRERVSCDLWRLEAHLERGEAAEALELYQGELLRGLELRGASPFDHWLDTRRRALAVRVAGVAGELAEAARDEGDSVSALSFARRALEIGPGSEEAVRRLMGVQLWAGDRAGALQTYGQFERRLAEQFEVEPSVLTRELADRARGGSSRPEPAAASGAVEVGGTAQESRSAVESRSAEESRRAARAAQTRAAARVGRARPVRVRPRGSRGQWAAGLILLSALLSGGMLYSTVRGTGAVDGGGAVALEGAASELLILPFEVRSSDPSLNVLREGMVELLAPIFTGTVGPRSMRPLGAAWGEAGGGAAGAARQARARGAEWFVTGRVLGDSRQVHLQAVLGRTSGDGALLRTALSGPTDSVYVLARELGGRLLAVAGGASEDEAVLLGRYSPLAIRMYLLGRDAYRRGAYEEADRHFRSALRHDSLFAQAALGLVETHLSAPWLHGHTFTTALPLAFRLRDRLSPADQEVVTAVAGPWYPGPSTHAEHYRAWERAMRQAPDRPEVWFQWGDALYHVGPYIAIPDARVRAGRAFHRTLELDSDYLLPLAHLTELAVEAGDVDLARSHLRRLLESPSEPADVDYLRWRIALAAGDDAELRRLRSRFGEMNIVSLSGIVAAAQVMGEGLDDAERIASLDEFQWEGAAERRRILEALLYYDLNRGGQSRARARLERLAEGGAENRVILHLAIRSAAFAGGDRQQGAAAAAQLGGIVEAERSAAAVADLCALETWKLKHGDPSTIEQSLATLRQRGARYEETLDRRPLWCAEYLEALRAVEATTDVRSAAATLRELALEGVAPPGVYGEAPRHTAIRALERQGDLATALTISRLRASIPYTLAVQLRQEGRLAAMVGDTAGALRAYEHYLKLRASPEPPLVPQRDSVLSEYRALSAAGLVRRAVGNPPR